MINTDVPDHLKQSILDDLQSQKSVGLDQVGHVKPCHINYYLLKYFFDEIVMMIEQENKNE